MNYFVFITTNLQPQKDQLLVWNLMLWLCCFTGQVVSDFWCISHYTTIQEWDQAAQRELKNHPHAPRCRFQDIAGFLKPSLACILNKLQNSDRLLSDLKPLVEKNMAVKTWLCSNILYFPSLWLIFCIHNPMCMFSLGFSFFWLHATTPLGPPTLNESKVPSTATTLAAARRSWCVEHERECDIGTLIGMVNIAGTVCTAHSAMGVLEREQSLSFGHFLVWAVLRRVLQEPLLVQECVDSFPREMLTDILDMYDWCFSIVSPHQHGIPVRRVRQWAIGRHKSKTLCYRTLPNIFTNVFTRPKQCDWTIYFWEWLKLRFGTFCLHLVFFYNYTICFKVRSIAWILTIMMNESFVPDFKQTWLWLE